MPLRLRNHVRPQDAVAVLRGLALDAHNVVSAGGNALTEIRPRYLRWAEEAEARLSAIAIRAEVVDRVLTERHWRIRALTDRDARPVPVIDAELAHQVAGLRDDLEWLEQLLDSYAFTEGTMAALLDTNVFLHYKQIDQIDWLAELGALRVCVVVPLAVINELDEHTYHRDPKIRKRAKNALRLIHNTVGVGTQQRVGLRARTEIQVMSHHREVDRDGNVDAVVIEAASLVQRVCVDRHARLVTGDVGMRLRATIQDVACHVLNEELRLPASEQP
jgi:hypothetical protein